MTLLPRIDLFGTPVRDCDHAPLLRDQQQRITALEAENRSLHTQLRAQEERLALYRDIDEAADRGRVPGATHWIREDGPS